MNITWKYVKPTTKEKINSVLEESPIKLPSELQELILSNNNGRPSLNIFDTEVSQGHVFKKLLSFNQEDLENIYDAIEALKAEKNYLFPFASDPAGNFICVDASGTIVYWQHETSSVEKIASTTSKFLGKLHN